MDWIASIFELFGLYIVGNKNRIGFVLIILAGISRITYVIISQSTYGLLLVVVPALIINSRNYLKWRNEDVNKNSSSL